jgi:hypothetical protein
VSTPPCRSIAIVSALALLSHCGGAATVAPPPIPTPASSDPRDACAGADVDLDALFSGRERASCVGRGLPEDAAVDPSIADLTIAVSPERTSIRAGQRAELSVVLTNRGSTALTLWFIGDLGLDPYVFAQSGARVVPPEEAPPLPEECDRPETDRDVHFARVTLLPGGRAHGIARWDGHRAGWKAPWREDGGVASATCSATHELSDAGPAAPGVYTLVVPVPLMGKDRMGGPPRVEVEVGR